MSAQTHNTAPSWAYRHPRTVAGVRFAVGTFLVGLGAVMLSRGIYALAALLLAVAALHFALGSWRLTAARSASPRTGADGRVVDRRWDRR
jgi:hypothetical protein